MAENEIIAEWGFVVVDRQDNSSSDNDKKEVAVVSWNSYLFSYRPTFCEKIRSWFTTAPEPKAPSETTPPILNLPLEQLSSKFPLLNLPLELQDHIFSFLDQNDLKAVSLVCKPFAALTFYQRLPIRKLVERMWKTNKHPDLPCSKIKELCAQLFCFEKEVEEGKPLALLPHIKASKPLAPYNSGERILPFYSFIEIEHENKVLRFPFEITKKAGKIFAHFYQTI